MVAHSLTRYAINVSNYIVWMEDAPSQTLKVIQADLAGFFFFFYIYIINFTIFPLKKKKKKFHFLNLKYWNRHETWSLFERLFFSTISSYFV